MYKFGRCLEHSVIHNPLSLYLHKSITQSIVNNIFITWVIPTLNTDYNKRGYAHTYACFEIIICKITNNN